ncbi:hypothetical protein [Sphaerimonospora mesophila]|uniref:hypothetical protein n=1 Tax=Sphaerimonospora mesophila TaxID=37483 RepID=UPI0006E1C57B
MPLMDLMRVNYALPMGNSVFMAMVAFLVIAMLIHGKVRIRIGGIEITAFRPRRRRKRNGSRK